MEKRYQVFISSTFQDLQNARQEVSQALLRADCFPAGMELFPAADEEQFEFIKAVIDQSDYYIIISAGRYGSIHPETGLSYTEMEYDYAVETGKPVIRLLHKDPFNELKGSYIEKTEKGRKLLEKFRSKMMTKPQRMVKFWSNELELGAAVDHSLRHLIKTRPALGWVRSDDVNVEIELENYRLKEMIEQTTTSLDDLEIAAALNMHVPLFERILRKELGEDFDALFLEVIEGIIDFFAEESRSAAEIAQCFQALGIGEDASHFLIDAMVTERIAEFTSEYREYYRLTQVAFDIVSQARLKSYLSI